jgi:hypothetical protein
VKLHQPKVAAHLLRKNLLIELDEGTLETAQTTTGSALNWQLGLAL